MVLLYCFLPSSSFKVSLPVLLHALWMQSSSSLWPSFNLHWACSCKPSPSYHLHSTNIERNTSLRGCFWFSLPFLLGGCFAAHVLLSNISRKRSAYDAEFAVDSSDNNNAADKTLCAKLLCHFNPQNHLFFVCLFFSNQGKSLELERLILYLFYFIW